MNSSQERYWWKSLPIPESPQDCEAGFSINGAALSELIKAVLGKNADFRFRARGYSMYPAIRDGDVITLSPIPQHILQPGDVAAYLHPLTGQLVVHRLWDFRDGYYLGAGDNSENPDGWVAGDTLMGIVTGVERKGQKIRWHHGKSQPIKAWLSWTTRMRITRWRSGVRRKVIQKSQSEGMKKISRPFVRAMVRSGLSSLTDVVIDPGDSVGQKQRIRIDLFLLKIHSVRMEFERETTPGKCRWWFSGSGTHPLFCNLDLEREVFQEGRMMMCESGESQVWVDLPVNNPGLREFCRNLGFIEEQRYPPNADCIPGVEGERILMKCPIGKVIS